MKFLWFLLFLAINSFADSSRMDHRFGAYVSVLGDPAPLAGINLAFETTDYLRLSAGSTLPLGIQAVGAGVTALLPGYNFSPTLGLHYAHVFSIIESRGDQGNLFFWNAGGDWTTASGFNLGFGLQAGASLIQNRQVYFNGKFLFSPYINIGWYFY